MEMLADQEHESWANWTRWMLGEMEKEAKERAVSEVGQGWMRFTDQLHKLTCVQRWSRQMNTTYPELSEKEKESDRKVVREKLGLYRGDTKTLAYLKTCLSVAIAAGGSISAVELRELVKACGLELEKV
jgi:hypothetical protein